MPRALNREKKLFFFNMHNTDKKNKENKTYKWVKEKWKV